MPARCTRQTSRLQVTRRDVLCHPRDEDMLRFEGTLVSPEASGTCTPPVVCTRANADAMGIAKVGAEGSAGAVDQHLSAGWSSPSAEVFVARWRCLWPFCLPRHRGRGKRKDWEWVRRYTVISAVHRRGGYHRRVKGGGNSGHLGCRHGIKIPEGPGCTDTIRSIVGRIRVGFVPAVGAIGAVEVIVAIEAVRIVLVIPSPSSQSVTL